MSLPTLQARQKRTNTSVNWGKRYPSGRGTVEYINVSLRVPQDFTIYLGDPSVMPFWNDRPFLVSVGNGGTTSNIEVVGSIRGTVIHACCQDLIVRGDTQPTEAVPADSGFRYQAHCGLGRPSQFTHIGEGNFPLITVEAGNDFSIPISPYTTHVWFSLYGSSAAAADTMVSQIYRQNNNPLTEVDINATVPFTGDPITNWLEPHALDPRANRLRIIGGAAAVFPGFQASFFERRQV